MVPNTMWPMLLDLSQDECKKILRRLELEAYSSIVSALRAQGALSKDKLRLLQDLASVLHISIERHKAEIRRAVNDEKLSTVAELMAGPNTSAEWAIEGRRLIPLMPRVVPQTTFSTLADRIAELSAAENAKLLPPSDTVRQRENSETSVDPNLNSGRLDSPLDMQGASSSPCRDTDDEVEEIYSRQHVGLKRRRPVSPLSDPPVGLAGPVQLTVSPPASRARLSPVGSSPQSASQPVHHHHPQMEQQREDPQLLPLSSLLPPLPPPLPPPPLQKAITRQPLPSGPLPLLLPSPPPLKQKPIIRTSHQASKQQWCGPNIVYETVRESDVLPQVPKTQPTHISKVVISPKQVQTPSIAGATPLSPQPRSPQIVSGPKTQEAVPPFPFLGQPIPCMGHAKVVSCGSPSGTPVKITFASTPGRSPMGNSGVSLTSSSSSSASSSAAAAAAMTTATNTTTSSSTLTTSSTPSTQKVIIVQSSSIPGSPGPPSILQRSLSVPVGKSSPATATSRMPFIISGPGGSPPLTPTTIVTISTNPANSNNLTATTVSIGGVPTTAYITSSSSIPRLRPKTMQLPCKVRPRSGSIVIPVTPNPLIGTSGTSGKSLKSTPLQGSRPGFHVRPETSGMKIFPVTGGSMGGSKILPKPVYGSGSQTPVYTVNSTTSSITMVTRTVSVSCAAPSPRMVTVNATNLPSPVCASQTRPTTPTLMTKLACTTKTACMGTSSANSGCTTVTSKPNVIVVQKTSRQIGYQGSRVHSIPVSLQEVFSKVVASTGQSTLGPSSCSTSYTTPISSSSVSPALSTLKIQQQPVHQQASNVLVLDINHENTNKSTMLADILQASGIITADSDALPGEDKEGELEPPLKISSAAHNSSEDLDSPTLNRSKSNTLHVTRGEVTEMPGELDPETGVFSLDTEDQSHRGPSVSEFRSLDIFNTTLASATIRLEEGLEVGLDEIEGAPQDFNNSGGVPAGRGRHANEGAEEQLRFLQDIKGSEENVTVEPNHIDTTSMHIEDYTSQKLQVQETTD